MGRARTRLTLAVAGLAIASTTALLCWQASAILGSHWNALAADPHFACAIFRFSVLAAGAFGAALCGSFLNPEHGLPTWRDRYTPPALAAACLFLAGFILHVGQHQFGAYDFNDILSTGWRMSLGQRPYVDFPGSTPPAFDLGLKAANAVLGVTWHSSLVLTAVFTCATFLWLYWLLRRLSVRPVPAMLGAYAVESAAMLTLSFWWYNNITAVLATVLLLNTMLLVREPGSPRRSPLELQELSYVAALVLLSWTKPGVAGLTMILCASSLLSLGRERLRMLALTLTAAALSVGLLWLNHIPVLALWHIYTAIARERGLGTIGYNQLQDFEQILVFVWVPVLALPFFALLPEAWRHARAGELRRAALRLFPWVAVAVAVYGIATNGEAMQVELPLMLAAGVAIVFGGAVSHPLVRRLFVALLLSGLATDLYYAAARLRILAVGPHLYFEWTDNEHRIDTGPLAGMRVSGTMVEVERQVRQALDANPGPVFFGPRVDLNYAAMRVPALPGLPAWWHPGTAFGRADESRLVDIWESRRFPTLIFLKGDYTYLSPGLMEKIDREYIRDDHYPRLTLYHRR